MESQAGEASGVDVIAVLLYLSWLKTRQVKLSGVVE